MTEETAGEVVAEPVDAPIADAPAPEAPIEGQEAAPADDDVPPTPDEPAELTPDQKAIKKLQGRVGFMTKTVNAKDAEVAELKRQNEAYQALLAANRPDGGSEAPAAKPAGERTYTEKDIDTLAEAKAAAREFNAQANSAYEAGKAKFDDFDDAVDTLRDARAMTQPLVEAALATGDAPAVLHHLGNLDPEEITRISGLSPVRMGVELAKIATQLSTPKTPKISKAPAPITPLGGAVKPELDITDPKLSMEEYRARRAAQGSIWAKGRNG